MRSRSPLQVVGDEDSIGSEHGAEGMQVLFERAGVTREDVQDAAFERVDELVKRLDFGKALAGHDFQSLVVALIVIWADGFVMGARYGGQGDG